MGIIYGISHIKSQNKKFDGSIRNMEMNKYLLRTVKDAEAKYSS